MSKIVKQKKIQFRISQLKEIDFFVRDIAENDQKGFLFDAVNTSICLNIPKTEDNNFTLFFQVNHKYKEETDLLRMNWSISFDIKDREKFIQFKDNNLNVDSQILLNFVNIGYGTLRGIIAEKTKGMFLNKVYLPVIDVQKLLPTLK